MQKYFSRTVAITLLSLISSAAWATHNPPGTVQAQGDWSSGISDLAPSADNTNDANTDYYFYATTDANFNPPQNGVVPPNDNANGTFWLSPKSPGFSGVGHINGNIGPVKANTGFYIYGQACDGGSALNGAQCSPWTKLSTNVLKTQSLNQNPGFSQILRNNNGTDGFVSGPGVSPVSLNLKTNNLTSQTFAQRWHTSLNGGPDSFVPYNRATNSNVLTNVSPNTKYTLQEKIEYYYGDQTSPYTPPINPIWTTPVNPGAVNPNLGTVTHCSIHMSVQNSAGSPPNPTYTIYQACAVGSGGNCGTGKIGGTPLPGDTVDITVNNLLPNTDYTSSALAEVGDGSDLTANGWNNSGSIANSTVFKTASWGSATPLNVHAGSLGTNTVTIDISGLSLGSNDQWQLVLTGGPGTLSATSGTGSNLPSSVVISGMNSNTVYNLVINLTDSSGAACTIGLPNGGLGFTTKVADPSNFNMVANGPFELDASWSDSNTAPADQYTVKFCTNSGMNQGCNTTSPVTTLSVAIKSNVNASTQYWAQVTGLSTKSGAPSNPIPGSAFGPVLTPADVHSITIIPSIPQTINVGGKLGFTARVTDPSGNVTNQPVTWAVSGGGSLNTFNGTSSTFTATTAGGPFTLKASLATYNDATNTITINATGPAFTTPPTATVNPDHKTGSVQAVATDQASNATPITYTWSMQSGIGAVSFSTANATTNGNSVSIAFSKAGRYTFLCVAADNFGNASAVTSPVVVIQDLNGIKVCPMGVAGCPKEITVKTLQDQQFTANELDQFGDPMTNPLPVTWTATGAGSVNSAGVFNSAQIGQQTTVTAVGTNSNGQCIKNSNGQCISGSALVTIIDFDVSNAYASPVPYKANSGLGKITFRNLGSQASIRIYTSSGRRVIDIQSNTATKDWFLNNSSGENVASGVYFYVIESPQGKKNGKLIIIQ